MASPTQAQERLLEQGHSQQNQMFPRSQVGGQKGDPARQQRGPWQSWESSFSGVKETEATW